MRDLDVVEGLASSARVVQLVAVDAENPGLRARIALDCTVRVAGVTRTFDADVVEL